MDLPDERYQEYEDSEELLMDSRFIQTD